MGLEESVDVFKDGVKDMLIVVLVIVMVKGLIVIVEDGKIIDIFLYMIVGLLEGLFKLVIVEIMFIF